MKKFTLLAGSLVTLLTGSFAQTTLQGGAQPFYDLVQRPLLLWDLMRSEHPGWTRQYRPNDNVFWSNANLLYSRKDASGRFTFLEYNIRDLQDENWQNLNRWTYTYKTTGSNITERTIVGRYEYENGFVQNMHERSTFSYDRDRLILMETERFDSSNLEYRPASKTFYLYDDATGNRRKDSFVTTAGTFTLFEYEHTFNDKNQCTSSTSSLTMNGSLVSSTRTDYAYDDNGKPSRIAHLDFENGAFHERSIEEYSYTPQGLLASMTMQELDGNDVMQPYMQAEHGFTATNKMQWMVSRVWRNNQWNNTDSVYVTFNGNDKADTSYGYIGTGPATWLSSPRYRFLFNDGIPTGLPGQPAEKLVFSAYPNPAADVIHTSLPANGTAEIIDMLGNTVLKQEIRGTGDLHIAHLPGGLYILRAEANGQTGTQKLLIRH
jgi:hypothetical protein